MIFLSLLTVSTAFFGFVVSAFLVLSPKHSGYVNRFLAIAFFTISYRSLSIVLVHERIVPDTFLMGSVSFVYYWTLPMMYLYVRSLFNDEFKLRRSDRIHFILPIVAAGLALAYIIEGFLSKTGIQQTVVSASGGAAHVWPVPATWHGLLLFVCGWIYTIMCWRMVLKRYFVSVPIHDHLRKVRNWVCLLLVVCTLLLLALFIEPFFYFYARSNAYIHIMGIRSAILIFLYAQVVANRELLVGLPEDEERDYSTTWSTEQLPPGGKDF